VIGDDRAGPESERLMTFNITVMLVVPVMEEAPGAE
jgi:hypothetical protein